MPLSSYVLDQGFATFKSEADKLYICNAEPTTFTEATSTFALGNKNWGAGNVLTGPSAGTDGRKVTTVAITNGVETASGTATWWAIVDSTNSRLLATDALAAPVAVGGALPFSLPSFDITTAFQVDTGWQLVKDTADKLYICSAQPTTYTEAVSTFALGNKNWGAGNVFTGPSGSYTPGNLQPTVLLHVDGANGSTTFTDSSPNAIVFTRESSNAAISTAKSKFGGSSINFPAATDYFRAAPSDLLYDMPGDFTVDFWINTTDAGVANRPIWGQSDGTPGFGITMYTNGILEVDMAGAFIMNSTTPINNGAWHHVAVTRSGSSVRLFIDGTQEGGTVSNSSLSNSTIGLYIGQFAGNMDEIRLINGTAAWTSNFTPPTSPYEVETRKLSTVAITDGVETASGTATWWAIVDSATSFMMLTGVLSAPVSFSGSGAFQLNSFDIGVPFGLVDA